MNKFTVGKRSIEIAVEMRYAGTTLGYKIGHLSADQNKALGYAKSASLATFSELASSNSEMTCGGAENVRASSNSLVTSSLVRRFFEDSFNNHLTVDQVFF